MVPIVPFDPCSGATDVLPLICFTSVSKMEAYIVFARASHPSLASLGFGLAVTSSPRILLTLVVIAFAIFCSGIPINFDNLASAPGDEMVDPSSNEGRAVEPVMRVRHGLHVLDTRSDMLDEAIVVELGELDVR